MPKAYSLFLCPLCALGACLSPSRHTSRGLLRRVRVRTSMGNFLSSGKAAEPLPKHLEDAPTTSHPQQTLSASWEDRASILSPGVNLFCWQRATTPMDEATQSYLASKANPAFFGKPPGAMTVDISRDNLPDAIARVREHWDGRRRRAEADEFWQDVEQLARDFISLSPTFNSGTLTLKVIESTMCPKFHMDYNRLRLLTTYLGKGTEWLPEDATNRGCLETTNAKIIKDHSKVQRMRTFDVGILKGSRPLNGGRLPVKGIVHRSPDIAKPGERRILLKIDI